MPYARNPLDDTRVSFEDDGGDGVPVILYGGAFDSIHLVRELPIARGLRADEFRTIYVDHRGLGRSDKPHDPAAYDMRLRVADALAVLDDRGIERAHFIGMSYGGRLCFGIGEQAPERVLSLVIGGQQPYPVDASTPAARMIMKALTAAQVEGMEALVAAMERFWGVRFPDAVREHLLANDPVALHAASTAMLTEGAVSEALGKWEVPCLIFVGVRDADFHDQARRAAEEIPNARFISLEGLDHLGAETAERGLLSAVLEFLREWS